MWRGNQGYTSYFRLAIIIESRAVPHILGEFCVPQLFEEIVPMEFMYNISTTVRCLNELFSFNCCQQEHLLFTSYSAHVKGLLIVDVGTKHKL